jgi:hypothetical protein
MRKVDAARGRPKEKRQRLKSVPDDEEIPEEEAEADANSVGRKKNTQYSLVHQNNGYWGCYDGREGTLVLFATIQQAKDYIEDLLHGRDSFRSFYGNKVGA